MDLENISPADGSKKRRKRIGRGPGSGTGKTSGKGHKGQKARSGYSRRLGFQGGQMPLHRRLPKRGFTQTPRHPMAEINVDQLEKAFESGAEVNSAVCLEKGIVKDMKGGIKVLGRGELTKKLTVKAAGVSASAREKIEAAGGSVEVVLAPPARAAKKPKAAKPKTSREG